MPEDNADGPGRGPDDENVSPGAESETASSLTTRVESILHPERGPSAENGTPPLAPIPSRTNSRVYSVLSEHATHVPVDIEHLPVTNDPRQWRSSKKTFVLAVIAFTALASTLSAGI
jgi:hypothetical protein